MSRDARPPLPRWLLPVVALYLSSGLPFGLVNKLLPVWLKVQGVSLEQIGLASLLGLPWTLKALWAPLVDRVGRAGAWIAGSMAVVAAATLLVPQVPLGPATAALLLAVAMASATQDIAVDGWVAAEVPADQQGRANGLRVAAYRAAMLGVGGGAVALAAIYDWTWIFAGVSAISLGFAVYGLTVRSAPRPPTPAAAWLRALGGWLLRPDALALLAFVLLFKLGDAAMAPMIEPFWLDAGLSVAEVGLISTTLGTALTVGGALLGGELTTRLGLFRALWSLGLLQALSNLGYALAALFPGRLAVYLASGAESFTQGLGTAAYLALLMRLCEGEQTATRFALLTALAGFTRTLGGATSGFGATALGYSAWFGATFLLALPAFALLPVVRRRLGSG